ncbi:hypothetical protein BU197_07290 [Streptomyces sp. CBMA291]|nr:hypothetical protein [Streptomyces sp. CBMA291]MBD0717777.1 hypothetical protein [Streptomyces sp. CBMA370]
MRTPLGAVAALASVLLLGGCSAAWEGARGGVEPAAAGTPDVFLQPLGAQGPDPFTASTVRNAVRPPPPDRDGAEQVREVTGSTPGLYGGTRSVGSCDVERQTALLTADQGKKRAFAEAAGIPENNMADWLGGLTPVVLRADVKVTSHGYREGRARPFQAVLQTGTAVLVDQYGAPRVRCAGGNPLRAPAATPSGIHRGEPWDGFDPDHVITIRPTTAVVASLLLVNATDRSWIERRAGSDGGDDRNPDVPPACDPDACALAGTEGQAPPGSGTPDAGPVPVPPAPDGPVPDGPVSAAPAPENPPLVGPDSSGNGGDTGPVPAAPEPYPFPVLPDAPDAIEGEPHPDTHPDAYPDTHPDALADPYVPPVPDPYAEPPTGPDGELPTELLPAATVPDGPENFPG